MTKKRRRGPCIYTIPLLLPSADHGQEAGGTIEEDQNSHVGDLERRRSDHLLRERNIVLWTFVNSMPFAKSLQRLGRFQNSGYLVGRLGLLRIRSERDGDVVSTGTDVSEDLDHGLMSRH
jgi:hypothetical protein